MDSVTIKIPATTANLGPGYDCLGVALQLSNRVTVRRCEASEESARSLMAKSAAHRFFESAKIEPFPFAWEIVGEVPQARGLGSSVTVRLGILCGLNALVGMPLSRLAIFELCAALEGHPDNAAPAAFGGFTVAFAEGGFARFEVAPDLHFVLLIPDFEVATDAAREVLPAQIDRRSAVKSAANACRITAAFAAQDYELLRGAFADEFHQPFREKLIPFLPEVIANGERAGALGGFLSGSGSTICCVVNGAIETAEKAAAAMKSAAPANSLTVIAAADNEGAGEI